MFIKIIGLLLTRDDVMLLEDWLKTYRNSFDELYVLDGSTEYKKKSKEILLKYNTKYFHDSEFNFEKKTDHILRGVIYSKIKEKINRDNLHNTDYWIVLAHPDEFYIELLKYVISKAQSVNSSLIIYNSLYNLPHISEKELYIKNKSYKIFRHFYHNGKNTFKENRIFKYNKELYYSDSHGLVIPHKLDRNNSKFFFANMLHYKVYDLDITKYKGRSSIYSCWSTLSSHYPIGHKFNKIDDFFLSEPCGRYKGCKIYNLNNKFPDELKIKNN